MKQCSTCKLIKSLDNFEKDSRYKSGVRSQCIFCNRNGKTNSALNRNLQYRYNISLEEFNSMVESQGGLCLICGLPETRVTRPKAKTPSGYSPRLAVDHDHNTGEIRGLLCHKCNVGLGNFQDNPELLLKAYNYLKGFK